MSDRSGLTRNLIRLAILPLVIFGVLVVMASSYVVYHSMAEEILHSLKILSGASYQVYELTHPGDYFMDGQGILWKGSEQISGRQDMVDELKETTGADVTLFYGDQRVITSVRGRDGQRAVGTLAAPEVVHKVLEEGEPYDSERIEVNGTLYFGYYMPLTNSDGSVAGMMFAGRPRAEVLQVIYKNIIGIIVSASAVMAVTVGFTLFFGRRLISVLNGIKEFLRRVAGGDLQAEMKSEWLSEKDELGEMARFSLMLRDSLIELVGTDPLTGLYNRRSSAVVLDNIAETYQHGGARFVLAMGDIDLFKEINDRYGHQAGDYVLTELAQCFRRHMEHQGFVFRWGGEEFLFIYEGLTLQEAASQLERLKSEAGGMDTCYEGICIHIAMTFGLADCTEADDVKTLIKIADENLYCGKRQGRNAIIYHDLS